LGLRGHTLCGGASEDDQNAAALAVKITGYLRGEILAFKIRNIRSAKPRSLPRLGGHPIA